jgi:prepilin-type N-terminal cleavage/methylation domain-containing protein
MSVFVPSSARSFKHRFARHQCGLTLMELMIAMALAALVLVALSGFTSLMFRAVQQDERLQANRHLVEQVTQRIRLELADTIAIETATVQRFTYTTLFNPLEPDVAYFRADIRCDDSTGALNLVYRRIPIAQGAQGAASANAAASGTKEWVLYENLERCRFEYAAMPLPGTAARGLDWQANPGVARARDFVFVRLQVAYEPEAELPVLFARVQMMR